MLCSTALVFVLLFPLILYFVFGVFSFFTSAYSFFPLCAHFPSLSTASLSVTNAKILLLHLKLHKDHLLVAGWLAVGWLDSQRQILTHLSAWLMSAAAAASFGKVGGGH